MSLSRFYAAQRDPHSGYSRALRELQSGQKTSHWIWYIFPQIRGLGSSAMAKKYALADRKEAVSYVLDDYLRGNYLAALCAVRHHLKRGIRLERLLGSELDAQKFVSSITLFSEATEIASAHHPELVPGLRQALVETRILLRSQGYEECQRTLQHMS
jgi:uncharacterized protein (DUF1810 family)